MGKFCPAIHAASNSQDSLRLRPDRAVRISRPAALDDVSLSVKAGEVIAVVGENGSGKSTLVNLLPRLYDPDFGTITIDGTNIRDVKLEDLRTRSVVTQETLLFDDTIYENIRYGKPDARRSEIEEAARKAYVTRFFDQMPDGFETRIGEKGGRLSGGQRQRIALARAILRDPAILILDEATSATDAQSEMLIHEALPIVREGADDFPHHACRHSQRAGAGAQIAVMDHGQLLAFGPHEEMLASCPAYDRLFHAAAGACSSPPIPSSRPPALRSKRPRRSRPVRTARRRTFRRAAGDRAVARGPQHSARRSKGAFDEPRGESPNASQNAA